MIMSETKFELRSLKSSDMFPMFTILSKIGFKELKESLSAETINDLIKAVKPNTDEEGNTDSSANLQMIVGFSVVADLVEIIMKNLPKIEKDLYNLLANLSGMKTAEIADLDMVTFTEMIISLIKKEEFKDFFKVVSGLFK